MPPTSFTAVAYHAGRESQRGFQGTQDVPLTAVVANVRCHRDRLFFRISLSTQERAVPFRAVKAR